MTVYFAYPFNEFYKIFSKYFIDDLLNSYQMMGRNLKNLLVAIDTYNRVVSTSFKFERY